jgi:hypothetical protein
MTNFAAAGVSFFSTEDAELSKSEALDHNAQVADFNADTTHQQGLASDQALDRDIRATQGRMMAAYGGSGVDTSTGSPLTVLADSIRKGVLDRATNKWNFDMQETNYRNLAASDRLDARNVRHAAIVKAVSAGLASFNGGNGGTGDLGESGSLTGGGTGGGSNNMWSNGNSLTGGTYTGTSEWGSGNSLTGGEYTGEGSMSTSWGGEGNGWGS